MQQICLIEYVDAQYEYDSSNPLETGLHHYEAFGYVTEHNDDIIVSFAQDLEGLMHMGLVIPRGMLITKASTVTPKVQKQLVVGATAMITWSDVVFFTKNAPRTESTVMETRGQIEAIGADHVAISNPHTQVVAPGPRRDHPEKKPSLYRIPLGAITNVMPI